MNKNAKIEKLTVAKKITKKYSQGTCKKQ